MSEPLLHTPSGFILSESEWAGLSEHARCVASSGMLLNSLLDRLSADDIATFPHRYQPAIFNMFSLTHDVGTA